MLVVHSSIWVFLGRCYLQAVSEDNPSPNLYRLFIVLFLRMSIFTFLGLITPQDVPSGTISHCQIHKLLDALLGLWGFSLCICSSFEALSFGVSGKLEGLHLSLSTQFSTSDLSRPLCPRSDSCGTSQPQASLCGPCVPTMEVVVCPGQLVLTNLGFSVAMWTCRPVQGPLSAVNLPSKERCLSD